MKGLTSRFRAGATLLQLLILVAVIGVLQALMPSAAFAGGASVCEIGVSSGTNIVSCAVNNGASSDLSLYQISIETGAAADNCVCFDSATPTGLNIGNDGTAAAPRIGEVSVTATNTTTTEPAGTIGRNAANGLMCGKSAAGGRCSVRYKKQ